MKWNKVKSLTIPEGVVSKVTSAGSVIWQKVTAALGMEWTASNVTNGIFAAVTYGGGIWVAGSDKNNGLYYSLDGKEWGRSNVQDQSFRIIVYANGVWLAPSNSVDGDSGGLYYSDDGKKWTRVFSEYYKATRLEYGGGRWVFCANGDTSLATSVDGKTWNIPDLPYSSTLVDFARYGGGCWLIYNNGAYQTENFIDYEAQDIPVKLTLWAPQWVDDRWICTDSGTLWTSFDGKTWTSSSFPAYGVHTFYKFGDSYISTAGSSFCRSTDLVTWTEVTNFPWDAGWSGAVAIGDGLIVVVSELVTYASEHSGTIWSTDADTWTIVDDSPRSVCSFGDGVFVANDAMGGGLYWSDFKAEG